MQKNSNLYHHFILFFLIVTFIAVTPFGLISIDKENPWTYFDAFYFIIITLTTIGYGEVYPLTPSGKIYIIIIIFTGLSLFGYVLSIIFNIILNSYLEDYLKKISLRRQMKDIQELKNHYIVCGYGKLGSLIAKELIKLSFPVVVIESDSKLEKTINEEQKNFLIGKAENDQNLIKSGIHNAKMIIITTNYDYLNIYITMSSKILNPKIYIITSYKNINNKQKIIIAGANKLIPIYNLACIQILQHIFNEFLSKDQAVHYDQCEKAIDISNLIHEKFIIKKRSSLYGKKGIEAEIKAKVDFNVKIIGLVRKNKYLSDFQYLTLKEDDYLLILAKEQDIELFKIKSG